MEQNLKSFLDGQKRLTAFPARRKKKLFCLFYLAEKIEAEKEYTEREINDLLLNWHTFANPATLRRELCDYCFLGRSRDGKIYRLADDPPTSEGLGL